jgi:hypothetical protein
VLEEGQATQEMVELHCLWIHPYHNKIVQLDSLKAMAHIMTISCTKVQVVVVFQTQGLVGKEVELFGFKGLILLSMVKYFPRVGMLQMILIVAEVQVEQFLFLHIN